MADVKSRLASVDYLISEVGVLLEIPDFAFDGGNECNIEYGECPLNLRYDPLHGTILVSHVLEVESFTETADLLILILSVNRTSAFGGFGAVVYDPDTADLVWIDRIEPRAMTALMFVEAIDRIYQAIQFWKADLLSRMAADDADPADMPAGAQASGNDSHLIFRL